MLSGVIHGTVTQQRQGLRILVEVLSQRINRRRAHMLSGVIHGTVA